MDRPTRWFILASLVYLAVGGVLGALIGLVPRMQGYLLFPHVHLLLGGFMAMMIYGVGYFIVPRFAARSLRWPALVTVHFWLANTSLPVMAIARPLGFAFDAAEWIGIFHLAALVQTLSMLLFVANLGGTLLFASGPPSVTTATATRDAPPAERSPSGSLPMTGRVGRAQAALGPDTPVGEIVDRKAGALELLVQAGLKPLEDPPHLEMVRRAGIPLRQACDRHGISLDPLLSRLRELPDGPPRPQRRRLTPDDRIGELVESHPTTREVFRQRFGDGCFTCPGFATETLAQGALMHGANLQELIAELERTLAEAE